jgi:hypothetical protein
MVRDKVFLAAIALVTGLAGARSQTAPHDVLGLKGVLTAKRQAVLLAAVKTRGQDTDLNAAIAAALGFAKGDAVSRRSIATNGETRNIYYVYDPLSDGQILLSVVEGTRARTYRLNDKLEVLAAVSATDGIPVAIPLHEAQNTVDGVLKRWSDIADQLQDSK